MLLGSINFAKILPQFWWDVIQLQLAVYVFFTLAGDHFLVIETRQAVFAECVTHLERPLTQRHVVRLAAGEVLHGSAKRLRRQEANVHLHTSSHAEADFILAPRNNVHEPWQLDD